MDTHICRAPNIRSAVEFEGSVKRQIIVTLIHGTWAENAAWTREGSTFQKALISALHADTGEIITCIPFPWSGKNTHDDRRIASICLRRQLRQQLREFPLSSHFLIAHSHGGNVAMRALGLSYFLQQHIHGLICIATPFLRFDKAGLFLVTIPSIIVASIKEQWNGWMANLKWYGLAIMSFPILYALDRMGQNLTINACATLFDIASCKSFLLYYYVVGVAMAAFAPIVAIPFYFKPVLRVVGEKLTRDRQRILKKFTYSQGDASLNIPVLGFSSMVDEALLALDGSWWVHRVVRGSAIFTVLILMFALGGGYAYALTYLSKFAAEWFSFESYRSLARYSSVIIAAGGILLLFLLYPASRLVASTAAWFRLGLGFGDRRNLLWKVSAHRHAYWLKNFDLIRYDACELLKGSKGVLFHSRIYAFQPAITTMARWIASHRK